MLSKVYRMTKRGSFSYVYSKGLRRFDNTLSLIYCKGKTLKIGFSVNNKVGKANVRNKLKRRLRAIVRNLIPQIETAQIVIMANADSKKLSFNELQSAIIRLLTNAKLLKDSANF